MKKKIWVVSSILVVLVAVVLLFLSQREIQEPARLKKIVINEAVRTILYLPLYHAVEKGYFKEAGLDVQIVTGGTATNSFAAMLSGEAQFSQADPMYVPISREKGGKTKVVAQVVGRIAVWGLAKDSTIRALDKKTLKGRTIATQVKPMTAYTYTVKLIEDNGLKPGKDVKIIETKSPNEIIPFLNGQADYVLTLEPNTSNVESKGYKVVLSYPRLLGDQVFTGLMTTEDYIEKNKDVVNKVVRAYQKSLDDLHKNPNAGIVSAKKYFAALNEEVLKRAINRMVKDDVIPSSVSISEESWNKAMKVRIKAGDLKNQSKLTSAFYLEN